MSHGVSGIHEPFYIIKQHDICPGNHRPTHLQQVSSHLNLCRCTSVLAEPYSFKDHNYIYIVVDLVLLSKIHSQKLLRSGVLDPKQTGCWMLLHQQGESNPPPELHLLHRFPNSPTHRDTSPGRRSSPTARRKAWTSRAFCNSCSGALDTT